MKKLALNLFIASSIFFIASYSSGPNTPDPAVIPPTTPPVTETDVLTTQNVKTYMVDVNATNETVALFYNLKKLSKTKFAIGQQDAFNAFYNNISGTSDIKKTTGNTTDFTSFATKPKSTLVNTLPKMYVLPN